MSLSLFLSLCPIVFWRVSHYGKGRVSAVVSDLKAVAGSGYIFPVSACFGVIDVSGWVPDKKKIKK